MREPRMTEHPVGVPWEPRWLGRLSHDLRNELVPLRTATDLLSTGRLDGDGQREMLAMIERQTRRLVRMLDDVSEYGRLLAPPAVKRVEVVDLALVVDNAVGEAGARLQAAGLRLDLQLPAALPAVRGDVRRYTQLLQRVLDNAIRFSPPAGGIRLTVESAPGELRLTVIDSGPGFAPGLREAVFEPPLEQRNAEGLGLSLLLARACARDYGGELRVADADEGTGGCLCWHVPLADD
jgi:signal transduction histidine kinase